MDKFLVLVNLEIVFVRFVFSNLLYEYIHTYLYWCRALLFWNIYEWCSSQCCVNVLYYSQNKFGGSFYLFSFLNKTKCTRFEDFLLSLFRIFIVSLSKRLSVCLTLYISEYLFVALFVPFLLMSTFSENQFNFLCEIILLMVSSRPFRYFWFDSCIVFFMLVMFLF